MILLETFLAFLLLDLTDQRRETIGRQGNPILALYDPLFGEGRCDSRPGDAFLAKLVNDREGRPDRAGGTRRGRTSLLEMLGVLSQSLGVEGHGEPTIRLAPAN